MGVVSVLGVTLSELDLGLSATGRGEIFVADILPEIAGLGEFCAELSEGRIDGSMGF
jgi:hypothetical protein